MFLYTNVGNKLPKRQNITEKRRKKGNIFPLKSAITCYHTQRYEHIRFV